MARVGELASGSSVCIRARTYLFSIETRSSNTLNANAVAIICSSTPCSYFRLQGSFIKKLDSNDSCCNYNYYKWFVSLRIFFSNLPRKDRLHRTEWLLIPLLNHHIFLAAFFVIETQEYTLSIKVYPVGVCVYDWPLAACITLPECCLRFSAIIAYKSNSAAPIIIISLCASAVLKRRSSRRKS